MFSKLEIRVSSPVNLVDKDPDRLATEPDKVDKFCSSVVLRAAIDPDKRLIELENELDTFTKFCSSVVWRVAIDADKSLRELEKEDEYC
jgi:hypothetical protein